MDVNTNHVATSCEEGQIENRITILTARMAMCLLAADIMGTSTYLSKMSRQINIGRALVGQIHEVTGVSFTIKTISTSFHGRELGEQWQRLQDGE